MMKSFFGNTVLFLLIIMCLFGTGCSKQNLSQEDMVKNFTDNTALFESVVEYFCEFDFSVYEERADQEDVLYGSFAVSDFDSKKYNMAIEGGVLWKKSIYYNEVEISDAIKKSVNDIFLLGYAYIGQINEKDDAQIIYFRIDDVKSDADRPHGVVFSEDGNAPNKLMANRDITVMNRINEHWFYFENTSYEEAQQHL